jgi:hypothetical protein
MNLRDVGSEINVIIFQIRLQTLMKRNIRQFDYNYCFFVDLFLFLLYFNIYIYYAKYLASIVTSSCI